MVELFDMDIHITKKKIMSYTQTDEQKNKAVTV